MHSWRAHREGMHACAAAPSEDFVVSAGRAASGGREADVLRVWDLAASSAGEISINSPNIMQEPLKLAPIQSWLTARL